MAEDREGGEDRGQVLVFPAPAEQPQATRKKKGPNKGAKVKVPPGGQRLTEKQNKFAWLIGMDGLNQTEAYRQVYDCENMAERTIWTEACMLSKNPKVSAKIKQLQESKEERAHHDGGYVRRKIIEGLLHEAATAERSADRLKAMEMLGKLSHVQAFSDKIEVKTTHEDLSSDEILQRLQDKLQDLAS